jgi:hypothetical protein
MKINKADKHEGSCYTEHILDLYSPSATGPMSTKFLNTVVVNPPYYRLSCLFSSYSTVFRFLESRKFSTVALETAHFQLDQKTRPWDQGRGDLRDLGNLLWRSSEDRHIL